jgi:hypothetical protein
LSDTLLVGATEIGELKAKNYTVGVLTLIILYMDSERKKTTQITLDGTYLLKAVSECAGPLVLLPPEHVRAGAEPGGPRPVHRGHRGGLRHAGGTRSS